MSHYEQRLEHDLTDIRSSISRMGEAVQLNLANSISALFSKNRDLAYNTILGDHPVNREMEALNLKCHRFIAKHLPSAGHLRFISSSLRIIILLERIGDYAVTISKEAAHVRRGLKGQFRDDAAKMADDAQKMLKKALGAYEDQNAEKALATIKLAKKVDRKFFLAYSDLVEEDDDRLSTSELFSRLVVIRQIERVSDQAKNLCEEIVFSETGKTKKRRKYRLLFLDEKDDSATQLAVAICRKYHGDRIKAFSAGSNPSSELSQATKDLCDERGLDTSGLDPSSVDTESEYWANADVFVTINFNVDDYGGSLPYDAAAVKWDLSDTDSAESVFHDLSDKVDDLVHLVRGPVTD